MLNSTSKNSWNHCFLNKIHLLKINNLYVSQKPDLRRDMLLNNLSARDIRWVQFLCSKPFVKKLTV